MGCRSPSCLERYAPAFARTSSQRVDMLLSRRAAFLLQANLRGIDPNVYGFIIASFAFGVVPMAVVASMVSMAPLASKATMVPEAVTALLAPKLTVRILQPRLQLAATPRETDG